MKDKKSSLPNGVEPGSFLSTVELAGGVKSTPASIRTRLCQTGSFHGVKPYKLPNGRLLWPRDSIAQLLGDQL